MDSKILEGELQIVAYVTVSFLALLIYDWFISLAQEVIRVWHSRWSVIKVLYLYTRYAPFVVLAIATQERTSSTCNYMTFTTIFAAVTIGISDLILMLRTYSIYNKSRTILFIFGLSWMVISAVCIWAMIQFTNSFSTDEGDESLSCFLSKESKVVLICYFALLGGECVITLLTFWKTFDSYCRCGFHLGQVVSMIYCEGLFYYFMILPLTIANVTVLLLGPAGFLALLDSPLTVMHSILCCRLVLHVREVSERNTDDEDEDDLLPTFVIVEAIEPYMSKQLQQYYV
ncbi:hypothetical protein J3R30DRAFT_3522222 [Lentinula aciculospora]|uniref:DUF6533 domain-containing protein n=1 Tax=Lentinula aciculospora TaxID=153920 RepID=A0A9W9A297_9AGAR|nr:hypothetical protein J3R30DRAFT_3522222 [Lentinula aciculospora]